MGLPPSAVLEGGPAKLFAATTVVANDLCEDALPANLAEDRLWGVTSAYDRLLQLQKEHHSLIARQREAELAHLRLAVVADSEESGGKVDAADAVAHAIAAKTKEIELLGVVSGFRDWQIAELQRRCEARQLQVTSMCSPGGYIPSSIHAHASEHAGAFRIGLGEFAQEGVDVEDVDASVDALRTSVTRLEAEALAGQGQLKELSGQLEMSSARAACLEAEVVEAERERRQLADAARLRLGKLHEKLAMQQDVSRQMEEQARQLLVVGHAWTPRLESLDVATWGEEALASAPDVGLSQGVVSSDAHRAKASRSGRSSLSVANLGSRVQGMQHRLACTEQALSRLAHNNAIKDRALQELTRATIEGYNETPSPAPAWMTEATLSNSSSRAHVLPPELWQDDPQATYPPTRRSDLAETLAGGLPNATSHDFVQTTSPSEQTIPHESGLIDAKLAEFMNHPENRLRKALLSRVSDRHYLYGTRRMQLRLACGSTGLEASSDEVCEAGSWQPLEEFMRGLERLQSERLRRARERFSGSTTAQMRAFPDDSLSSSSLKFTLASPWSDSAPQP